MQKLLLVYYYLLVDRKGVLFFHPSLVFMIIHGIRSGKSVIGKLFEVKLCNINQACNLKLSFHTHVFVLDRFRKHTQITVLINATSQNYCQNRKNKWVLQMCRDKLI